MISVFSKLPCKRLVSELVIRPCGLGFYCRASALAIWHKCRSIPGNIGVSRY